MCLRALIIDDSAEYRQAAQILLEREGITVVATLPTGAEALSSAPRQRPDVILVDVMLAGENGFDVAEHLCQVPGRRWQVVLISALSQDDYADLLDDSPAIGFLPKAHLSATAVAALLGRHDSA